MCRGILSTIYAEPKSKINIKEIIEAYRDFYKTERFVRVFEPGTVLQTAHVRGTNFCNISPHLDERTGKIIVISVIDNLVKGQAGNAVQNMNIMFGLDESLGLNTPGIYP
jgi:N-acetyl-gamma-glutamyl-phosphate reductase